MTMEIPLSRGLVALVDDADYALVSDLGVWHAAPSARTFYGRRNLRTDAGWRWLFMHTVILGPGADHINCNGLDNRRANLRRATPAQNARNRRRRLDNTSGYTGVSRKRAKWRAEIRVDGRAILLGIFITPDEAALVYDAAATLHFGEFARLNFPKD